MSTGNSLLGYLDLRPHRELIVQKAWDDFRAQAIKTYLGAFWWILDPLISMLIYYVVFGLFFQRGGPDFIPFLLTGIVIYHYFQHIVNRSSVAIYRAKGIIRQVAIPKIIFPVINILTQTYQLGFSLILLFIVLQLYGFGVSIHIVAFPVVLLVALLFSCAITLPLSAFVPFVPDLSNLAGYFLRLAFFMSGVMYDVNNLSEKARFILQFNPMVHVITAARDCVMYHRWPDWSFLGLVTALSVVGILIGAAFIRRYDLRYAKEMEE